MNNCEWCQKPIEGYPEIHDLDLDIYFHHECNFKDDAINALWEGLEDISDE